MSIDARIRDTIRFVTGPSAAIAVITWTFGMASIPVATSIAVGPSIAWWYVLVSFDAMNRRTMRMLSSCGRGYRRVTRSDDAPDGETDDAPDVFDDRSSDDRSSDDAPDVKDVAGADY